MPLAIHLPLTVAGVFFLGVALFFAVPFAAIQLSLQGRFSAIPTPEACCAAACPAGDMSNPGCVSFCSDSREAYYHEDDGTCIGIPPAPAIPPDAECAPGERRACEVCTEQGSWRTLAKTELTKECAKTTSTGTMGPVGDCSCVTEMTYSERQVADTLAVRYYDRLNDVNTFCLSEGGVLCKKTGTPSSGTGSGLGKMKELYGKATMQEKTFTNRYWELKATLTANPFASGDAPVVEAALEFTSKSRPPPTTGNIIARAISPKAITDYKHFEDLPAVIEIELDDTTSAEHIFSLFFDTIAPEETFEYVTDSHYLRFRQDIRTGTLSITSVPDGAAVAVDGKASGTAPLTLKLPIGTYTITAEKTDHRPREDVVRVRSYAVTDVVASLDAIPGTLLITSTLQGITVKVDGAFIGFTPFGSGGVDLLPGTHILTFEKAGYVTQRKVVTIEAHKNTDISVALVKMGTLRVVSTVKGTAVAANGRRLGYTNTASGGTWYLDTLLAPGTYKVAVSKSGYKSQTLSGVSVVSGTTTSKTFTLKK